MNLSSGDRPSSGHLPDYLVEPAHLPAWLGQLSRPARAGRSQPAAQVLVSDQAFQLSRKCRSIAGRHQRATGVVEDFQRTAASSRDYWQARLHRFDKSDAKRLRAEVGLAIDIGRGEQTADIRTISQ